MVNLYVTFYKITQLTFAHYMLRKVMALIVLVCHINSSMFLPQGAEQDIFNFSGQQQDDINTVVEYINQVVFGKHVKVPQDEDDDSGQNFHMVKEVNYFFEPFFTDLEHNFAESENRMSFSAFLEQKIAPVSFEILSPPPDAC